MELRQGSMLQGGKYVIIRVLGQGGFGITYLAEHTALRKKVAVKEFFPKTFCGRNDTTSQVRVATEANVSIVGQLKKKFIKEAQNLAKMDCPYIVRIIDVFEENDTAYYIMDYIEGRSLSDIVKSSGPLPVSTALGYVAKIGEALEYIHSKRINHLDVKPANIMVRSSDGRPIMIDFGLSKQYDNSGQQTSTTPVGISHGFTPIEQYSDGGVKEFSPQTDVYALAATFYFLLSGKTPAQAPDLISQGLTFPPLVPESLRAPIKKAMSAGRHDRYPTVSSFIEAIATGSVTEDDDTRVIRPIEVGYREFSDNTTASNSVADEYIVEETPFYKKKWFGVVLIALLIGIVSVLTIRTYNNSPKYLDDEEPTIYNGVLSDLDTVTDMGFNSSLGYFLYTGEVDSDSIPHGLGKATFYYQDIDSTSAAKSYDGEWIHGIMQGQATYKMRNGDVFKGIFRDNKFSSGRYMTSDGDYFEGSFRDEQPYNGSWYNKNGRVECKVINGKES